MMEFEILYDLFIKIKNRKIILKVYFTFRYKSCREIPTFWFENSFFPTAFTFTLKDPCLLNKKFVWRVKINNSYFDSSIRFDKSIKLDITFRQREKTLNGQGGEMFPLKSR